MKKILFIIALALLGVNANAQVAGGQISRQKSQQTTKQTPKTTQQTTKKNTQGTAKKQTHCTTQQPSQRQP